MTGTRTLACAAAVAAMLSALATASAQWKPAEGPLMTRWAKDVSPEKAHPEYPRPQMVRADWQNLNGLWDYAITARDAAQPTAWDGKILVPFPAESALSGVRKAVTPDNRLWYRRTFTVPAAWKARRVVLHFGAVDWEAVAYVNGKELGSHRGGYDAFSFDITDALRGGENELVLAVWDPSNTGAQGRGKQVLKPGGIMYTATTGIWQTAWLEPVAPQSIAGLRIVPDVDGKCLRLTVAARGGQEGCTVRAAAFDGGRQIAAAEGPCGQEISLPIADPKLWWPDDPHLYDLKVTLRAGNETADEVSSYFGMRKIELGKDDKGFVRMLLNGKSVFQIGTLDQGFWPDGIYTAPTDEALRYDIEALKKLGFNMTRKHVKIEPDRWYYWCDKLGLLVWQDMVSGNTAKDRPQFQQELTRLVEGMGNHPSIVMWVVFNEGWGQIKDNPEETKLHVDLVRKLDPTRLINNASGWTDHNCGDVRDVHSYPGPAAPKPEEARAGVLGEFGGLGLPVKGHLWQEDKNWGYRVMSDAQQLTARYVELLRKVYQLKDSQGLCAGVYTQTTDCEIEVNGLLTYDRAVIKTDVEKTAAANRGEFPPAPVLKTVLPTSETDGLEWRYTTDKPGDDWFKADFDDGAWKTGPGGFGTAGTPGSVVRTNWNTPAIWLRRTFELGDVAFTDLQLRIHHDEDVEVYINGVRAAAATGYTTEYVELAINRRGLEALKKGKNVLAVYCKQLKGGQYVDVGLVDVAPPEKKQAP